ncbi:MAG: hypothetical protein GY943_02065 [Chloroflexi bacterium]|nr:hypothetical protein [Chloroflexota bacterium]
MTQSTLPPLTPLQQTVFNVVCKYPGRFSRSGLAKMLVGAKSWQEREFPEYGRLAKYGRKEIIYQIDILVQQSFLELEHYNRLVLPLKTGQGKAV